jgi:hypothetical protein
MRALCRFGTAPASASAGLPACTARFTRGNGATRIETTAAGLTTRAGTAWYWDGRGECPLADPFGRDAAEFGRFISAAEEHDDIGAAGRLNAYVLKHIVLHYRTTDAALHIKHASRAYRLQRVALAKPKTVLSERWKDYCEAVIMRRRSCLPEVRFEIGPNVSCVYFCEPGWNGDAKIKVEWRIYGERKARGSTPKR